jgi:hypothetical protein
VERAAAAAEVVVERVEIRWAAARHCISFLKLNRTGFLQALWQHAHLVCTVSHVYLESHCSHLYLGGQQSGKLVLCLFDFSIHPKLQLLLLYVSSPASLEEQFICECKD